VSTFIEVAQKNERERGREREREQREELASPGWRVFKMKAINHRLSVAG